MDAIIEKIVAKSRLDLTAVKIQTPAKILEKQLDFLPETLNFAAALRSKDVAVIAEIKKASPSCGLIRVDFDPEKLAVNLASHQAAALSVITEKNFFSGDLNNLKLIRQKVQIPLLRKDFIFDEYQILEARCAGADAVLLIAAMLDKPALTRLKKFAESLQLQVLFEAHTPAELDALLELNPEIVGVNARNLKTFATDLNVVAKLLQKIPDGILKVSESAIKTSDDLFELKARKADAFLIGETLMRSTNPGEKLCELIRHAD